MCTVHAAERYEVAPRFDRPDALAGKYPHISPYAFCANNPVNVIDPTVGEVKGVSKQDAKYLVEDFRAMFPGEELSGFRNLIVRSGNKQNGKSLAQISDDDLKAAFKDIKLNEDQQALVDMVVNSINSEDMHEIEYAKGSGVLSKQAESSFLPRFMEGGIAPYMSLILEKNGGIPFELIINEGGGGVTTPTARGSFTLIILGGEHPNGRPVTTGHEILGHGRSSAVGVDEKTATSSGYYN